MAFAEEKKMMMMGHQKP